MIFKFIPTTKFKKSFKKLLKKYPSVLDDFEEFKKEFSENPEIGEGLGGGFRKVRVAIQSKNKGKSGGARIITYNFCLIQEKQDVLLIDIYDKSELSTIQDTEYKHILKKYIENNKE
jgi:hypothetical protein